MLSQDLKELYEAYHGVYEERVNDDLLDDYLIEEIVEELIEECVDLGYSLDESTYAVENASIEYLMELNPYAPAGSKEARSYQKSTTATKRGEARKAAVKGAVARVKDKLKGAKSAAGIAGSIAKDEVRRVSRKVGHEVQKASSAVTTAAKEKKAEVKRGVKGLIAKGLRAAAGGAGAVAQKARKAGAAANRAADRLGEEVDVFDIILEYLILEGYAENEESATVIMANMSEDWRESILEGSYEDRIAANNKKYDAARKRAAQRAQARNEARAKGQTGNVPGVGYVSPRAERTSYTDSSGTQRHHSGAKMP